MTRHNFVRGASVLLAVALVPGAPQAQARGTWVLTPYAGVYVPATKLARFSAEAGGVSAAFNVKHDNAFALGGTASYWFADRAAVEFGGAYAFSHIGGDFRVAGLDDGTASGRGNEHAFVAMGSAKLMYALLPTTGERQLRFGIGPAVIRRGGTAYKADDVGKVSGLTDVGAALSLCTRLPIRGPLSLRLRAEDYMYQAQIKLLDASDPTGNFNFDRRFQNDFIFSAGLQIGLHR